MHRKQKIYNFDPTSVEGKFRSHVKWHEINYSIHPEQVTSTAKSTDFFLSASLEKHFITTKVSTWFVLRSSKILQPEQLVAKLVLPAYCTLYVYKNIVFNAPIYILLFNWHALIWEYSGVKRTVVMNTVLIIQRLTLRIRRKKTISGEEAGLSNETECFINNKQKIFL